MGREAKKKLFYFVSLDKYADLDINIKKLSLETVLGPGQLVLLLRMITNLVHINHRAQIPFEEDNKNLHMIMGRTHESATQATMSEWAIMFIRNVTEMSEKLKS